MASGLYDKARESFLAGDIDWQNDTIKVVLVDATDYTVDFTQHDNLDDVPALARVATSNALAGKTVTGGTADADNVTLAAVTGDSVEAIVVYKEGGSAATSPLIAYIEAGPITPNGTDIVVQWDDGPNKIFTL